MSRRSSPRRHLLVLALLNLFFLTVYASTWVSNLSWGDNLNLQILWAHLRHPTLLFAVSPYSQSMTVALVLLGGQPRELE